MSALEDNRVFTALVPTIAGLQAWMLEGFFGSREHGGFYEI